MHRRSLALLLFTAAITSGCQSKKEAPDSAPSNADPAPWTLPSDHEIEAILEQRMQANGVGIVVGVLDASRRSVVVWGRSGDSSERPLDGDSVFQLGSVTKGITALLLAEMTVRGEVALDDRAQDLLPEGVSMPASQSPITLRHLSTHTSGLPSMPDNFDLLGMPDPYAAYSEAELHAFLSSHELESEPGTERAYSNLGVALLGRLLADRNSTTYEQLVTERVLAPLGMTSTSIQLSADQRGRLAPGHDPYMQPIRTWEMATLQASGSLRSSANDMLQLLAFYLDGSAAGTLTAAAELQMSEGVTADGRFRPLGWGVSPRGTVNHSGGKAGYRSGFAFNRETGIGAVVLANSRTDDRPIDLAVHLVDGSPLPPVPPPRPTKLRTTQTAEQLRRYQGEYQSADGQIWQVAAIPPFLRIRYPGNAIHEFVPSATNEFLLSSGNDDISFEVDSAGQVRGMTVFGDGKIEGGGERAALVSRDFRRSSEL